MILRRAHVNEISVSYQCIEDARVYHRSMGFVQWHPDYPTLQTIQDDIKNGIGFVFVEGDEISFIEITKMYDPSNTSTQVATHRKFYTFTKDGLRLRQRIEWLGSYNLTYSYLFMLL